MRGGWKKALLVGVLQVRNCRSVADEPDTEA